MEVINLKEKGSQIAKLYQYEVIANMNNHNFTLVRVKDRTLEFHTHPDSDEVFLIVDGQMKLEFRDNTVDLKAGEMCVVPKGTEHRPICTNEVTCLLIEQEGTLTPDNTGGTYKEKP
ncbi:MAG: cupin domain-containing protein [Desulfobacterales bacterium]|nr:cupin domain-containing protein [Deltaproteobacteria bacterium]NNL43341.1 cupin domain-containing protein [Desulfobacterales bacterium]